MRIINITALPLRIPLKSPFHMAHFTVRYMHYVLVKVETDSGLIGYGEATPAWEVNGETCDSIVGFLELLKNKEMTGYSIIGEELSNIQQVEKLIDTIINPINTSALVAGNSAAKAALEQAIYHVYCLSINKSFLDIYNIVNKPIPYSITISIADIKTSLDQIAMVLKKKPSILRLKIGRKNIDGSGYHRDMVVIKKTQQMIQSQNLSTLLVADANQSFQHIEEVKEFCKDIEGCLTWLEQPLVADEITGFRELKKYTKIPLMADESITSYKDAKALLELGVDYLNIKLMKVGGLRGALKTIDLAKKYNAKCYIGSMIESSLGITMGCLTYLMSSDIVGTDLNVYAFLNDQIADELKTTEKHVKISNQYPLEILVDNKKIHNYSFSY